MSMSILAQSAASTPARSTMRSSDKEDSMGVLWWEGHQYRLGGFRKDGQIRWRCRNRNCGGRLFSDNDEDRSNKFIGVPHEHACVERCIREEFGYVPMDMSFHNTTIGDESSNDSQPESSSNTATPKRPPFSGKLEVGSAASVPAQNLFEYEWPPSSGEQWFLQEQITEYLGITSFKRKYPDITRRQVEKEERDMLTAAGAVTELVADFGLCALRSEEVIDLMITDYRDKYELYQRVLAEMEKAKEMQRRMEIELIKADSRKMAEMRVKALQQATKWNAELNESRKKERSAYWDISTMTVQQAFKPNSVLPADLTKPVSHPCALLPEQYVQTDRKYTPDELNRLPLNTVIDSIEHSKKNRPQSPGSIVVTDQELQKAVDQHRRSAMIDDITSTFMFNTRKQPASPVVVQPPVVPAKICTMCQKAADALDTKNVMSCTACASASHVACLNMSSQMHAVCKAYNWMCLECKPCSVCTKVDQEDKMIFCDVCDRGYHTFCVGMSRVPSGRWVCTTFCAAEQPPPSAAEKLKTEGGGDSGRSTPVGDPIGTCESCQCTITKVNKVHHRSKYRNDGICTSCARQKQANREPPSRPVAPPEKVKKVDETADGDDEDTEDQKPPAVTEATMSESTKSVVPLAVTTALPTTAAATTTVVTVNQNPAATTIIGDATTTTSTANPVPKPMEMPATQSTHKIPGAASRPSEDVDMASIDDVIGTVISSGVRLPDQVD